MGVEGELVESGGHRLEETAAQSAENTSTGLRPGWSAENGSV